MKKITVKEYAKLNEISVQRVYQLIKANKVKTLMDNKIRYIILNENKAEIPVNIDKVDECRQDFKTLIELEELKIKFKKEQEEKEKYKLHYHILKKENEGLKEQKKLFEEERVKSERENERLHRRMEELNILQKMALEQVKQLEQVKEEKGFFTKLFKK